MEQFEFIENAFTETKEPRVAKAKTKYDSRNDLYLGEDGKEHWGFHLLLDMNGCNANINNEKQIVKFIKELVYDLDMTAVGEPVTHSFGTGKDGGWSAMQLITTSTITLHGANIYGSLYVDIFSCKPFKSEPAIKVVQKYFAPKRLRGRFLYRDAPDDTHPGKSVSWVK